MAFAKRLLYLLVCFLAGCLVADWAAGQVVQVGQHDGNGSFSGSGTLVCRCDGGIVLTCEHIFHGGGSCWVDYGQGRRVSAQLLARNATLDVAVLRTGEPPSDVPCLPIAGSGEYATAGDPLEFYGFAGGKLRRVETMAVGYERHTTGSEPLVLGFVSISGDSGGPALRDGKIVAVQHGNDGTRSFGANCVEINRFLTQYQIPHCASGQCGVRQYQPRLQPVPPRPAHPPQKPVVSAPPAKPCNCSGEVACRCKNPNAKSCDCDRSQNCRCDGKDVAALEARIVKLESWIAAHKPYQPDYDAVAKEVERRLPGTTYEIWDDGKKIDSRTIKLGGTVPFERYSIGGGD
ncbi:MAG: trypsin-like peptidase domain-containing protein [Dokdonella sp.]|nr:trypsin-like peptidase domain-containing protein [Dokdonella sp.]